MRLKDPGLGGLSVDCVHLKLWGADDDVHAEMIPVHDKAIPWQNIADSYHWLGLLGAQPSAFNV
ncbi:hypothetical protein HJFPF1_10705 [Paramyrothecium foliicola]|nr:hypothetical protein HJFPF1_10705 [Paramyrothecium foliicola]